MKTLVFTTLLTLTAQAVHADSIRAGQWRLINGKPVQIAAVGVLSGDQVSDRDGHLYDAQAVERAPLLPAPGVYYGNPADPRYHQPAQPQADYGAYEANAYYWSPKGLYRIDHTYSSSRGERIVTSDGAEFEKCLENRGNRVSAQASTKFLIFSDAGNRRAGGNIEVTRIQNVIYGADGKTAIGYELTARLRGKTIVTLDELKVMEDQGEHIQEVERKDLPREIAKASPNLTLEISDQDIAQLKTDEPFFKQVVNSAAKRPNFAESSLSLKFASLTETALPKDSALSIRDVVKTTVEEDVSARR